MEAARPSNSAETKEQASIAAEQQAPAASNVRISGLPSTRRPSAEAQPTPDTGATGDTQAWQSDSPELEEIDEEYVDEEAEAIREANIKAMLNNDVKTERTAVMPKFLMVRRPEAVYRSQMPDIAQVSQGLEITASCKTVRFTPNGSTVPRCADS